MRTLALLAVAALIWATGLVAFSARVVRSTPAEEPRRAQGIVALTGASDQRIEAATGLLQQGLGVRMLVSGVDPRVRRTDVRPVTGARTGFYDCCIDLGFEAADTLGNARETAAWARSKGYRRLILVTADYHMPRAALELRAAMPEAEVQTYPVVTGSVNARRWWTTTLGSRRMIVEYCKYLAILGREAVLSLGPQPAVNAAPAAPATVDSAVEAAG